MAGITIFKLGGCVGMLIGNGRTDRAARMVRNDTDGFVSQKPSSSEPEAAARRGATSIKPMVSGARTHTLRSRAAV